MVAAQDIFAYHPCEEADSSGKTLACVERSPAALIFLLRLNHCNKRLRQPKAPQGTRASRDFASTIEFRS